MAGKYADGVYDHKPWSAPAEAAYPPQQYIGPFANVQDMLLNQALATNTMSRPELMANVRPALPQVELFPDRYGYTTEEIALRDIIDLRGRGMAQRNESDYSQTPATQQSTSRNALGDSV